MAQDKSVDLRVEARAVDIWKLDKEHKNALEIIAQKMLDAHNILTKPKAKESRLPPSLYFPEKPEFSNVVFISGPRGVGKTSLLFSLMSAFGYCVKKSSTKCWFKQEDCDNKSSDFCHSVKELNKKIILLKPLELESLPGPANLLASIFARLNDAVKRFDENRSGSLFNSTQTHSYISRESGYHDAIMEFQRLQNDVAIAWGGNLPERAARIDPDVFAVESLRAENARIDLNRRFNKVLDDLAQQIFNTSGIEDPMFILPVDDFDLNPQRYIEMLRLLDLVPASRLFIIILGNLRICRRLLYFKLLNDFHSFPNGKEGPIFPTKKAGFEGLAQQIAAHTLRKYIPPGHIVYLESFERKESIANPDIDEPETGFEADKVMWESIDLMGDKYKVEVKTAAAAEEQNGISLKDFLRFKNQNDTDHQTIILPGKRSYANTLFFHLPYRHRHDLLMKMRQLKKIVTDKKERSIRIAYHIFHESLSDEKYLGTEARELCRKSVGKDFVGNWELDTEKFGCKSNLGSSFELHLKDHTISFNSVKDWTTLLLIGRRRDDDRRYGKTYSLKARTGAAIAFYHDLLALKSPSGITGDNLIQKAGDFYWAYAGWGDRDSEVKISWLLPPFRTFWECAPFRCEWNEAWERAKYALSSLDRDVLIRELLFVWIFKGFSIIENPVRPDIDIYDTYYRDCIDKITRALEKYYRREARNLPHKKLMNGWIANVACTLAPESGIHEDISRDLIKKLGPFFIRPEIARQIRKTRTKRAVLFLRSGYIDEANSLFQPVKKSESKENAKISKKVKSINEIEGLKPYAEDIASLAFDGKDLLTWKNSSHFKKIVERLVK